jgi:putative hemolysin
MWIEVIVIILLFMLNGLFSMAEIAIVSARRARLEARAKRGQKGAQVALDLSVDPTRFLSTVQVGITLIGVLTGFYSGSVFSDNVSAWLLTVWVPLRYAGALAVVMVLLVTTYLSLVLGELVPKKIGLLNPEGIASAAAIPMRALSKASGPVVTLLTLSTNFLVKLFRLKASTDAEVTEEEVKSLIAQGTTTGTFDKVEQSLVERVFHFSDRTVGSLMKHRAQIDWVDMDEGPAEMMQHLVETTHSHLVLCEGDLDKVLGTLPVKAALTAALNKPGQPIDWRACLEKPYYVPDTMGVLRLVEKLRERKKHLALVVNEYGSVQGVITQTDVFDGLVKDLDADTTEEGQIILRHDGTYLIDGALSFADFLTFFDLEGPTEPAGFHTVAGFFLAEFKQIPAPGNVVEWNDLRLEVMDLDGKRIDKLLLTMPPMPAEDPAA